jgi:hypothetical protein
LGGQELTKAAKAAKMANVFAIIPFGNLGKSVWHLGVEILTSGHS